MKMTTSLRRCLRLTAPIAALAAVFAMAVPAWASTVRIQDDANVLTATTVQNGAATLPVGIYIWTTTQDAASNSTFDTDVKNKVSSTYPIVLGINTQSKHDSVQIGSQAGLSQSAAVAAGSQASTALVSTMKSSKDYTAATMSAVESLRTSIAAAKGSRPGTKTAPANSNGEAIFVTILVVIGVIIIVAIIFGRRRSRSQTTMVSAPPMASYPAPPASYPGAYPAYGPPQQSGMSPGAAGALGAVGGGLLGYELGKMEGEREQHYREEHYHREGYDHGGQYSSPPDQGNWVVGQDGDFGDGGGGGNQSNQGGGGDW